jgi:hypothetical protein
VREEVHSDELRRRTCTILARPAFVLAPLAAACAMRRESRTDASPPARGAERGRVARPRIPT